MSLNLVPSEFEPHMNQITRALDDSASGFRVRAAATIVNTISSMIQQSLTRCIDDMREAQNSPSLDFSPETSESFGGLNGDSRKQGDDVAPSHNHESFSGELTADSPLLRRAYSDLRSAMLDILSEYRRLNPSENDARIISALSQTIVIEAQELGCDLVACESDPPA